ncbi:monoamine oxidase [Bacillus sp. MUM 116]|uniref:flavin monoamine oxidase family protein n=1 Tax=Bacillus sp. MUM 116 TaxID=1678002 RepID=UPI0008F57777|nr:NAD(P)/FAD-dependent oxidoreductase [Bacillus sp. MUM 116]OIK17271.1 monoamine oxidase [Bacillus sp. MUM 116]
MARTPLAKLMKKAYMMVHAEMEKRIHDGQAIVQETTIPKSVQIHSNSEKDQPSNECKGNHGTPRIVIIGAGLAGLTCAYRLKQAGISTMIYEATDRVGGRCRTRRGYFKDGQIVEQGGELIDTNHQEIQELAKELGLEIDDLYEAETKGTEPVYFFDGQPYTYKEAANDFMEIYPKLQKDLKEAGETTRYNHYTTRGYELDHMSIVDYINETVPGGTGSRFGQLLTIAYTIEYGADAHLQSALNLLYLLGFAHSYFMYGESDERYHIRGGNDQLPMLLAKNLNGQIRFNSELIKIEQNEMVRLVFKNKENEWEVLADKVILCIPFNILRNIDFKNARFQPLKKIAIQELGMGVNTKLHAQFAKRYWCELGNNGETLANMGYQQTFESTRAQLGDAGILVNYTGGENAAKHVGSTDDRIRELTKKFLDQLELVLPGSVMNWNSLSTLDHWLSNQWSKGSYSFWKVGQYTKFAGIEGEREGNIYFAGEHTSIQHQGFLNGAVETGERAAKEVINDLKD